MVIPYETYLSHMQSPTHHYNQMVRLILAYHATEPTPLKRLDPDLLQLLLTEIEVNLADLYPLLVTYIDHQLSHDQLLIGPSERVYLYCLLLPLVEVIYTEHQIPLSVFFDTISDLFLRIREGYQTNHGFSLNDEIFAWLHRIFTLSIFKLGELQFEMLQPDQLHLHNDCLFNHQCPVDFMQQPGLLNLHIMEASKLQKETISSSLAQAQLFFSSYFPNFIYQYSCCYSWLLYPPMLDLLNQNSHIRIFQHFFTIIGSSRNPEMAIQRIYKGKTLSTLKPADLTTSLQKQAFQHPQQLGVGLGLLKTI